MEWTVSPLQAVSTGIGILLALYMLYMLFIANPLPSSIPRIRDEGKSRFSVKTRLAYYTDCPNLFREAYEKYSKKGKTCVIPGLGVRQEVILPIGSLKWATTQPESVLSAYDAFIEMDQARYTACDEKLILNPWQGMLVKRDMNRVLETLAVAIDQELKVAFDQRLGTDVHEWNSVRLYDTMRFVVAQASSRFTVGLPLCRNEEYLKASLKFADWFVINAGIIGGIPEPLRSMLGPILSSINRYYRHVVKGHFKPVFEKRLDSLRNRTSSSEEQESKDHLQMMLEYAQVNEPQELNLHDITGRLAVSNFGSMHQTSFAITNVILNILESDPRYGTISVIRKEVRDVLASTGGAWTKSAVAKMVQLDSIMRESLRLHSFGNRSIIRKVVAAGGVNTEDGHHIPKGFMVSILAAPAQTDPEVFEQPLHFDPFRFSRLREHTSCSEKKSTDNIDQAHSVSKVKSIVEANAPLAFVSTGPNFLPFGHGKHACPGRFLLDFELKMIVAHLFARYDLDFMPERNGVRPRSSWVAEACFPPMNAMIRFKSRHKEA